MIRFSHVLLATFVAIALSACSIYGKDNTPKPLPLTPIDQVMVHPTVVWSRHAGSGTGKNYLRFAPAVADQRVFVVDYRGALYAFDARHGQRLWLTRTKLPLTTGPGTGEGVVVVATDNAKALAYDALTGNRLWIAPLPTQSLAEPTVVRGTVFINTIDGQLTALDAKTGRSLWHYQQTIPSLILQSSSRAIVNNDTVVVGFANGKIAVLGFEEGNLLYEKVIATPQGSNTVSTMVDIDATPAIHDEIIYAATYQGNVAALAANSGHILWQHPVSTFNSIAIDDNQLYISQDDSSLLAFDQKTGNIQWKQDSLLHRQITGPALIDDYLVVGDSEGYLHWIATSDGHLVGRNKIDSSAILGTPVVVDHIIYVTSSSGTVTALRMTQQPRS